MFNVGDCFDFEGVVLEIIEKPKEELYKVKYFIKQGNDSYRKEGLISEALLKFIPTFPF